MRQLVGAAALAIKAALVAAFFLWANGPRAAPAPAVPEAKPEIRGTWLTTTANDAIATPERTAATMRRLREIGLNTVYVEVWKNGYTQFPSQVLERTIGVAQRPVRALQDPADKPSATPARDLLQETLVEAHRNGLNYVAWFEYGFMAAHGSTQNTLRRLKPEWLSRDIAGNEVAPNGFVWLNPLHPEARRFVLDLMLEAIEKYDLDGVQLDDRIVWPYVTMGYDDFTRAAYAAEHAGRQPPSDARDPAWMRWRADKLNALARDFVAELHKARPGLLVSMSPAPYPWSYEHYLLEWPQWARWPAGQGWDEFIPQAYRMTYAAFESTWQEQIAELRKAGAYRPQELVVGPYQGTLGCLRIAFGRGVCGAAAATGQTQLVEDVHAFPGHIACDAASRSELVVPLLHDDTLVGVIDLDSPLPGRFDADDQAGIEAVAAVFAGSL